jgi:hypothetical protein
MINAFGCSISEAMINSESINKMMEQQKNNKTNLMELSKGIKIDEIQVVKKLG